MGVKEIMEFLTYLAVDREVSASTQNQALNALVFLHKKSIKIPPDNFNFKHARIGKRLPFVLSRDEAKDILSNLHGEFHFMASLLYGSGLRLTECLRLRVKDIDFKLNEIIVGADKGDNDWRTILPSLLIPQLKRQIGKSKIKLEENMSVKEFTGTSIQEALERKYPNSPKELA